MATHYCIHGATNNGDGTTSAEASSPGGVGAFNDAITCLNGTQAGIADGDTVIFQTNNGTSDISVTLAADLTIAGAAGTSYRRYIFDDGTVWSAGVFTIDINSTGDLVTLSNNARLYAGDYRLKIRLPSGAGSVAGSFFINDTAYYDGVFIEQADATASFPRIVVNFDYGMNKSIGKTKFLIEKFSNNVSHDAGVKSQGTSNLRFSELVLEFGTGVTSASGFAIFYNNNFENILEVDQLVLINPPSDLKIQEDPNGTNLIKINRFKCDNPDFSFDLDNPAKQRVAISDIKINGNGYYDFRDMFAEFVSEWRANQNYPVFNALLPDETTPYSVRCSIPFNPLDFVPIQMMEFSTYYDQTAAAKKLTVEALIYDQFTGLTGLDFWAEYIYEDSSGNLHTETTQTTSALTTSAAAWDTTGYGPINFDKYKFELATTSQPLKQNSIVHCRIMCAVAAPDATSFAFIDPYLTFGAP